MSTKPKEIPTAKIGKRTGTVGLAVAPPPPTKSKRDLKPEFDKSLHVSRLSTAVTIEEMNNYISTNSSLSAGKDFKCTLLVKKGQTVETLSFVSYKVDVIEEKSEELFEEEFWPNGVAIRPFIPSTTLGDFLKSPSRSQPTKMMKSNDEKNVLTSEISEQSKKPNNDQINSSKERDDSIMVVE